MPFEEHEATEAQLLHRVRCEAFAAQTADRIYTAENCLFSLLPEAELVRLAAEWHDACCQAMLRGDYSPIDKWVRSQGQLAAAQGFAARDFLQLLQICRDSAIKIESWNPDIFSSVDEVIHEVFAAIRPNLKWKAQDERPEPEKLRAAADPEPAVQERTGERRRHARNRLQFPIRILSLDGREVEEITETHSVSRGGLYFMTRKKYEKEQCLKINFPYWNNPGALNSVYAAKIIRVDRLPDHAYGVGVDFIDTPGPRRAKHENGSSPGHLEEKS